jgi:hypothetical protein
MRSYSRPVDDREALTPRRMGLSLAAGALLSLLSLAIAYPCCLNGNARGFPFAAYLPVCESTPFWFRIEALVQGPHVYDPVRLLGNLLLWSGLVLAGWHWVDRLRNR